MIIVLAYNGNKLTATFAVSMTLSNMIDGLVLSDYKIVESYCSRRIVRMVAIDEPNNAYELFDIGGKE